MFGESKEKTVPDVMVMRKSSQDMILDTRTPPKIKIHTKKREKPEPIIESSHAGVAIPINEDSEKLEETTKKNNFYKLQRPTTNNEFSTWILLSGESTSTTPKAVNITDTEDLRVVEISGTRIVKPMFRKRTTTKKPTTQIVTQKVKTTGESMILESTSNNSFRNDNNNKHIKMSHKQVTDNPIRNTKVTTFNRLPNEKTVDVSTETSYTQLVTQKYLTKNTTSISSSTKVAATHADSQDDLFAAKDGDASITEAPTNDGKKKKVKSKKNKNKNRRKKPLNKSSNSSSIKADKHKTSIKEKPLGTQLYNYLSREMMPTLGVGLVGLMVTAGLASYFLYPFGAARRVYAVDRKDKEGSYYYNDMYSGGIAEEEAFGKVIAGMPLGKLNSNSFKLPTTRGSQYTENLYHGESPIHHQKSKTNSNYRNHQNNPESQKSQYKKEYPIQKDHPNIQHPSVVQGTVENVPLGPNTKDTYLVNSYKRDNYQPNSFNNYEQNTKKDSQVNDDKKFYVGSIPKGVEDITPATVPEHGPRMLRIRRKRRDINEMENEVYNDNKISEYGEFENNISENPVVVTTTHFSSTTENNSTDDFESKMHAIVNLIKDVFHLKLNLGLELVKNASRSISTYIDQVQIKLDDHYKKS